MKKNCFKKALGIILVLAVIVSALNFTVSARYKHIDGIYASLSISSSGLATCEGLILPSDNNTSTTLIVELQYYSNGSWTYNDSWYAYGTGRNIVAKSAQKYVVHGKYRVVSTAKIYSSSGTLLENESCISPEFTY